MKKLGRPVKPLILLDDQREQLKSLENSRSIPNWLAKRLRIVLLAGEGQRHVEIARQVGHTRSTVSKWILRYRNHGIEGLHDELRSGRPRSISDEKVAEVIHKTLSNKPEAHTRWTCQAMAGQTAISAMAVSRIWRTFGLKPHRSKTFKLSTDPFFVDKVRDVVGLYLDPPHNAIVLSVDEKSQCQALECTQPTLPLGFGYLEGYTHDYVRHGVTTLFAALEVANGKVITKCAARHRHQEFLQFLRHIDANVPADQDVHIIMDNYSTHKHEKLRAWFARNPRYHIHFTPTYSSWLNQVEAWFSIITRKTIRRNSFRSIKDLVRAIDEFVHHYNKNSKPFAWTATADSIFQKLERFCKRTYVTEH